MYKAQHYLTMAVFAGSLTMQGFGLHPAVRPCCASKVNPRKNETTLKDEKKKATKRTEKESEDSDTD